MASAHMFKSQECEQSCERRQFSEHHKYSNGGHGMGMGMGQHQQHHGSAAAAGHMHMQQHPQGVMCHDAKKQHHNGHGIMGMIKQEYKKKDEFKCKSKGSEYKCKEKKSYKKKSSRCSDGGSSSSSDSD